MAAVEHDLSPSDWSSLQVAWSGCAYCGATDVPLQKDCVLPISRGGRYTVANVVPACGSCNASKCNDEVTGWLRRKRLDERAFLIRHAEVLAGLDDPGARREQGSLEPGLSRAGEAAPLDLAQPPGPSLPALD